LLWDKAAPAPDRKPTIQSRKAFLRERTAEDAVFGIATRVLAYTGAKETSGKNQSAADACIGEAIHAMNEIQTTPGSAAAKGSADPTDDRGGAHEGPHSQGEGSRPGLHRRLS
jgi:hypothetical protein